MLRASLKAQGKPLPEVPNVPQLWGEMPHPLEWSLSSVTGNGKRATAADLLEVSRKVSRPSVDSCCPSATLPLLG